MDIYFPHSCTLALAIGNLVEIKAGEIMGVDAKLVPALKSRFGAVEASTIKGDEPPRVNISKRTLSAEKARLLTPPIKQAPRPASKPA